MYYVDSKSIIISLGIYKVITTLNEEVEYKRACPGQTGSTDCTNSKLSRARYQLSPSYLYVLTFFTDSTHYIRIHTACKISDANNCQHDVLLFIFAPRDKKIRKNTHKSKFESLWSLWLSFDVLERILI